jgi:peptidoglycan/xylan/chitin deacetylase (PgdA/CDA1 family)
VFGEVQQVKDSERSLVESIKHAAGRWGGFSFGGQEPDGVSVKNPLPRGIPFPNGARAAILLTFDVEGNYGNGAGDESLEIENYRPLCARLRKRGVVATFNVVARMAEEQRDGRFIGWMVEAGSEVASHGYVHDMQKRYGGNRAYGGHYGPRENEEQVRDGIAVLNPILKSLGADEVRGMRFPYGHFNEYTYEAAERAGLSWTSNVGIDDFIHPGQGYGNAPFTMRLGGREFDTVEIPLDTQTYDWSIWIADEKHNGPFVAAVRRYCTLRHISLLRTPAGAVRVWRQRVLDTVESGGVFTLLCHPINLTITSGAWVDPLEEFLYPVIDMLAGLQSEGKIWVCSCNELAGFYRNVQRG